MADRQRWVIKIGSALLTNDGKGLDCALMQTWVDRMVMLRQRGIEVVDCLVRGGGRRHDPSWLVGAPGFRA